MNRRDLLRIGMKAILVAPLIVMGIKALPKKDVYQGPEIWIDGSKITNFVARVRIKFGDDKSIAPDYEWEYLDENEL